MPVPDARVGLGGGSLCEASSQCLSSACTVGVCSDWEHAMRIGIDTTATGANVHEPVKDFPLLVRLDGSRFPFAQARADGADIRFVAADGRTLSYEIERWDRGLEVAELWVLVPRVEPASADNSLVMYWGNPLATPASSGPQVFGAFASVMHMVADADGVATQLDDSSSGDRVGSVQNGSLKGALGTGIAGPAMSFDGSGTYVTTSTRTGGAPVSVSLWLRTSAAVHGGISAFASKSTGDDAVVTQALRIDADGHLAFDTKRGNEVRTVATLTSYRDDGWHFVVTRLSDAGQYLFVDGEPVADDPANDTASGSAGYWRFGEVPAGPATSPDAATTADVLVGDIDEVRIALASTSDAWIKLAYATQRPDATAVSYRPAP